MEGWDKLAGSFEFTLKSRIVSESFYVAYRKRVGAIRPSSQMSVAFKKYEAYLPTRERGAEGYRNGALEVAGHAGARLSRYFPSEGTTSQMSRTSVFARVSENLFRKCRGALLFDSDPASRPHML